MGREWKKHKYIRKENGRYYYPKDHITTVGEISGIEDPDLEGLSNSLEKFAPVAKVRDILNTPIYSSDPEQETLIANAEKKLNELISGRKDKNIAKGGN